MAKTSIARIDAIFDGVTIVTPIAPGDPDAEAVGAIQDLLVGLGYGGIPLYTQNRAGRERRGQFGPKTTAAVKLVQARAFLPQTGQVDTATLRAMAFLPPIDGKAPRGSRAYLALALDIPFDPDVKIMSLVAIKEGGGRFRALNLNTDKEGMSFGLIQWAQSKGRLVEVLRAMRTADPRVFDQCVGGTAAADGMIAHAAKPGGGVYANQKSVPSAKRGVTTDDAYDFTDSLRPRRPTAWVSRFENLAASRAMQRAQSNEALRDLRETIIPSIRRWPYRGQLSERAMAYLIDLINQHGPAGGRRVFNAVYVAGDSEATVLQKMENESVRIVANKYGAASSEARGTRERRLWFRTTDLLDGPTPVPPPPPPQPVQTPIRMPALP